MASTEELLALGLYRCYHCGLENTEDSFSYFDNKKLDQPRYRCKHCHKHFTLGSHGRPQGTTYAKKRNEDPAEMKGLSRQCRHCGVADNALFKFYNNKNPLQPRFKCMSCKKQFQMRLVGSGEDRRLVHTSSQPRKAPRRPKPGGGPQPLQNGTSSNSGEGYYQPLDDEIAILVPCDAVMRLQPEVELPLQEKDEDVDYCDFIEAELLAEEEKSNVAPGVDPTVGTLVDGDDVNLLPPLSEEDDEYCDFLEAELMAEEELVDEVPIPGSFTSCAAHVDVDVDVDGGLTLAGNHLGDEEVEDSTSQAGVEDLCEHPYNIASDDNMMVEMETDGVDGPSHPVEVLYGTRVVESVAFGASPCDIAVGSFGMSHADLSISCDPEMEANVDLGENCTMSGAPVQPMPESSVCEVVGGLELVDPVLETHLLGASKLSEASHFQWNCGPCTWVEENVLRVTPWAH